MRILVVFETSLGRTKLMAEAVCQGARSTGVECEVVAARDFSSLDGFCAVAVGSSTRMTRPLPRIREILSELKGVQGMPAAAFGSYGWSGEAPDIISDLLRGLGARLVEGQPVKAKEYPDEESLQKCRELGMTLAKSCAV